MIAHVTRTALLSLGVGFICEVVQGWLASQYLTKFLEGNLINLLVALLAVNSATMGIVLTKIRELVEKYGHGEEFQNTKDQFLLSVREQVALVAAAIFLLTLTQSEVISGIQYAEMLLRSCIVAVFVYSMMILYDVAKGVLIILDFKSDTE